MNEALKVVLLKLLNHRIIGEKHTLEMGIIKPRIKYLPRDDQKQFEEEYSQLVKAGLIIRLKKKTGKGSDWHISLNPDTLTELRYLL